MLLCCCLPVQQHWQRTINYYPLTNEYAAVLLLACAAASAVYHEPLYINH
jgi:hypothetical protein